MSPTPISPKLLSWAGPDLEQQAQEQALRCSRMPFLAGHVALMPDAHFGMGATVGSVIPTKGAIIPSAVGVDLGCGMIAAQLNLTSSDLPDNLSALHSQIARDIPAGVGKGHEAYRNNDGFPSLPWTKDMDHWTKNLYDKSWKQFGSLGSGNHFVEVCLDENDAVWAVLHSGSRGVGNELAKVHIEGAKNLMKDYFITLEDADLAYLVEGTPAFDAYITDMLWAQQYALGNRESMMTLLLAAIQRFIPHAEAVDTINAHHNFTQMENHHGKNMWITRKGAIKAATGDRGVIPGSMGTRSYIVSGLGSEASYCSCSHGAGRSMSRAQARRELSFESLQDAMQGKTWNNDSSLIDEHPDAYKDIDVVMENQSDLVKIEHTLHQVLNYKGVDSTPKRKEHS